MFLVPNRTIIKKGLQGGKLASGKEYLELTDKVIEVLGNTLFHFKKSGAIVDEIPKEPESTKSEKRLALEKEATDLEIEFTDRTSGKELQALIDAKKEELEK